MELMLSLGLSDTVDQFIYVKHCSLVWSCVDDV